MRFQFTSWTGEVTFVDADNMRDAYIKLGYPKDPEDFDAHLWEEDGIVTNRNGDEVGRFAEVDAKRSKWNILEERMVIKIAEVERGKRELQNLERITYLPGQLVCSGCGVKFWQRSRVRQALRGSGRALPQPWRVPRQDRQMNLPRAR